jgi:pimeloyl-ACP methyl ester carboxylesterase
VRDIDPNEYEGTNDVTYSVANALEQIKLFKNSPDAKVVPVEGGHHFLSASHPDEVASNLLEFVKKYGK